MPKRKKKKKKKDAPQSQRSGGAEPGGKKPEARAPLPVRGEAVRSFFDETLELLRGFVPPAGGIPFGLNAFERELKASGLDAGRRRGERSVYEQTAQGWVRKEVTSPERPDATLSMSFASVFGGSAPSLCVVFGAEGIEEAARDYEHVLAVVTDCPAFFAHYPEGAQDPRLKGITVGGFVNLGSVPGESAMLLALSLLNAWILQGPFFAPFRSALSFDVRFNASRRQFFEGALRPLGGLWGPNLAWFLRNEERVSRLAEANGRGRGAGPIAAFAWPDDLFVSRFTDWLSRTSGAGTVRVLRFIHQAGWDAANRRWDPSQDRRVDPEELLAALERECPAFGLELNTFTSVLQTLYEGNVSPCFVLNRCGVPLHRLVIDPVMLVAAVAADALSDLMTGGSRAFFFSAQRDLPNCVRVADPFFPSVLAADPNGAFSNGNFSNGAFSDGAFKGGDADMGGPDSSSAALRPCGGAAPFSGFFIATLFRQETVLGAGKGERLRLFFTASELKKALNRDELPYYLFFRLLMESHDALLALLLGQAAGIPCESFFKTGNALGFMAGLAHSITKLAVAFDATETARELGVPFRIHTPLEWAGGSREVWRGYLPKDEVDALGRSGWVRVSPQPQFAGEPFHDMNDALKHGYACVGINAHAEDQPELFRHIEGCTFARGSDLRARMREAASDPQAILEAMRRAAARPKAREKAAGGAVSIGLYDRLRAFPREAPRLASPVNRLSCLLSLPPAAAEGIRTALSALEPLLIHPSGAARYTEGQSGTDRAFAELLRSYLVL